MSNSEYEGRWTVPLLLLWSIFAVAQLKGRFYLEKDLFAKGEPVFLYFELTNGGLRAERVSRADPYSFCSGFQIRVSSDPRRGSVCADGGFAGSCLSSELTLEPGKQFTQRILLNYEHRLNTPGDYDIDAVKHLGHFADFFEVRKQLHLRVTDTASFGDQELQLLAGKLKSKDADEQDEAARTLASVAPLSLESTILGFADNEQFRRFAPLAFHNLNTDRSLSALGELVIKTKPGTYEQMEGIKYLAETGDSRWFPLLRELAQNHANISNHAVAAAEAGGDEAVPFLVQQMRSEDKEFAVPNAVSGFGYTGSRAAVPILLDLLKSPEDGISQRALFGLRKLTHMSLGGEKWFENPQKQYVHWFQWWSREGATARIYKATESGEYAPVL